jgi:predicted DNA-binding transcriptional regulator YafY
MMATDKNRTRRQTMRRLHLIHREIAGGGYPSLSHLARMLEVTERTVKREIEFLRSELNAPLKYSREKNGYCYAAPGWSLPLVKLSEGELLAFFIAENALRLTGHAPQAQVLKQAFAKLATLLPEQVSFNLATLGENINFQALPFAGADWQVLQQIAVAAVNLQTIEFDYYSPHKREQTHRRADVYLLHNFAGDWFAVSYDYLRGEMRDFHVGRMKNVKLTNSYFEVSAGWNAAEYLKSGFFMMRGGRQTRVEIEFEAHQAQWIRERRFFHPDETREELADGKLKLSFRVGADALEAVSRFCLTYAGGCRVLNPPKLKEIMREKLMKGLAQHQ